MKDGFDSEGPWARRGTAPPEPDVVLHQARAFLTAQNYDAAFREAARVLELDPDGVWGYLALDVQSDALCGRDDHLTAYEIGRRMVAIRPHATQGYVNCIRSALHVGDYRTADQMFDAAFALDPHDFDLHLFKCVRFRNARCFGLAEEWALKALELRPRNIQAMNMLALTYISQDKLEQARQIFAMLRELEPENATTAHFAACEAFRSKRYEEAERLAEDALSLDPTSDECRTISYRSRIFKHPLMGPFWSFHRLPFWASALSVIAAVVMVVALSRLGALVLVLAGAAFGYYALCSLVVGIVEMVEAGKGRRAPTLKGY